MEKSIWNDLVEINEFPKLNENLECDVLIVGGGVSGILCSYELKKRGIKSVIVEKDRIGKGITKNTTSFITAQHETLYQDLIKDFGHELAGEYLKINLKAVEEYKKLGQMYDIDLVIEPSALFTRLDESIILKEKAALESLGYQPELIDELPVDLKITKGIMFKDQASINPLKLIKELSQDLTIYENIRIVDIKGNTAYTNEHQIKFKNVVIATNYPFIRRFGLYFMKLTQRRSSIVGIKGIEITGTYCSIDEGGMYFRKYQDYLIIGGNDRDPKYLCNNDFNEKVKKLLKIDSLDYSWTNQDTTTIDGVPYIGKYDLIHKNWYVITGFNLWGFTWAMAGSWIISDMIEKGTTYKLTDPNRNFFKAKFLENVKTYTKNLINFKKPRCNHMGSRLIYNKEEKTWECPSHGSRFDENGNLLNGPATKGIKENINTQ